MEDNLAIILGSLGAILGGFAGIYQWFVKSKEDEYRARDNSSDNFREDFKTLAEEFKRQNSSLRGQISELSDKLDEQDKQLQQQNIQLGVQNEQITELKSMLKKAIDVIEKLGGNPGQLGIRQLNGGNE